MDQDKWWTKYHHEEESSVSPTSVQSRGCGHDDETEMKRAVRKRLFATKDRNEDILFGMGTRRFRLWVTY